MKRCPKCDFGFVNFHQVCDFDGTDLVDAPETLPVSPAVTALAATQSPFLRLIKSPVVLIVLALAGILSSLLLMVYYDAAIHANSIAEIPAPPDSAVSVTPSVQLPPPNKMRTPSTSRSEMSKPKAAKDLSATRERSATVSRSRVRLRSSPSIRNQQSRPEIALQSQPKDKVVQKESKESAPQRDSKENANRKESKLTATLKSTWRIIKKPFKF